MLKLSTRVRYGTRAMLDLALHYGQGQVLLKEISRRQEISQKYLDQIFCALKTAGLVKALRGAKGGYCLSRPPKQISVKEVMEAIDGPLELVGCLASRDYCRKAKICVTHDIWSELSKAIELTLKTTTLEDLVIRNRKKKENFPLMYHI